MDLNLFSQSSPSLVKRYLTRDIYRALKDLSTDSGFTLEKAIRSGRLNADSAIGIYAGDAQSYTLFSALLKPIINHYHNVSRARRHTGKITYVELPRLDPEGRYILSTRIRAARNIQGYSFTNHIKIEQRQELETKVLDALGQMRDQFHGTYTSIEQLDEIQYAQLVKSKLLFTKGDRFQDAAGINSDFPQCRGVFSTDDGRFRVWVNEEDHLRIISQDSTSDLAEVFNHFCKGILALEGFLDFTRNDNYGYLTTCPTNIGTAMRAGVHIRLDRLSRNRHQLTRITSAHGLQIRGTSGEKTDIENNIFDISNRQRYGISEVEIIHKLQQGLQAVIAAEEGN